MRSPQGQAQFRSNGLTALGAEQLLWALPEQLEALDLSQNDLSHGTGQVDHMQPLWWLEMKRAHLTRGSSSPEHGVSRLVPSFRPLAVSAEPLAPVIHDPHMMESEA